MKKTHGKTTPRAAMTTSGICCKIDEEKIFLSFSHTRFLQSSKRRLVPVSSKQYSFNHCVLYVTLVYPSFPLLAYLPITVKTVSRIRISSSSIRVIFPPSYAIEQYTALLSLSLSLSLSRFFSFFSHTTKVNALLPDYYAISLYTCLLLFAINFSSL